MTKDEINIIVNRTQLPLTLAYAFTDYRAQGEPSNLRLLMLGDCPGVFDYILMFTSCYREAQVEKTFYCFGILMRNCSKNIVYE